MSRVHLPLVHLGVDGTDRITSQIALNVVKYVETGLITLEANTIRAVSHSFIAMPPKKLHVVLISSPGNITWPPSCHPPQPPCHYHRRHYHRLTSRIPTPHSPQRRNPPSGHPNPCCRYLRSRFPRCQIRHKDFNHDAGNMQCPPSVTPYLPWTLVQTFSSAIYFPQNLGLSPKNLECPNKEVVGQYVDQKEPIEIPGCKSIQPEDVVDPMLDRDDEDYRVYLKLALGVTLRAFHLGPIIKEYEPVGLMNEVIQWLDKQPEKSVIYSFGSGGTISAEQIIELACGLEMSQQRFVWVVRPPTGQIIDGSFFRSGHSGVLNGQADYLPDGFLTRTKKLGFVVPSWAPQVEILNHASVGGFLTHCGWNSILESISSGVPMIAWALYAEQRMNAAMLTEELKVAVRPEVLPAKKEVGREEVEKMGEEGKTMTKRVERLKEGAEEAISLNGTSYISMCRFIEDCVSQIS
ncbi:hypothetical protein LXL04_002637 [Taraxacum kok-saghyz]